ncbi:MAG: hypothetical protein GX236_12555 [Clostridiaceae bacterium]|nr:hypothetical protein [Clostridiaceae bacterium]
MKRIKYTLHLQKQMYVPCKACPRSRAESEGFFAASYCGIRNIKRKGLFLIKLMILKQPF